MCQRMCAAYTIHKPTPSCPVTLCLTADPAAWFPCVIPAWVMNTTVACHVLQAGVIGQLPLYDFNPGVRLGLASMMVSALSQLSLEAVHGMGYFSLEQLLQQEEVFGRLLTVMEVQEGRRWALQEEILLYAAGC